jgi:nucleotide-binding universal stress UspA family protein
MSAAVVVGVSPTTGSPSALRWAAEEARLRGVALRAVMAWRIPRTGGVPGGRPPTMAASTTSDYQTAAEQTLRGYVSDSLGTDSAVECTVVKGSAVHALLTAARGAQLLVVGEPRFGRLNTVRASLVAPQLVHKAGCPVVVMPATAPRTA